MWKTNDPTAYEVGDRMNRQHMKKACLQNNICSVYTNYQAIGITSVKKLKGTHCNLRHCGERRARMCHRGVQ